LKNPTGSVRFRFFKPGTGKTEPKKIGKKTSQTEKNEPNRFELVFALKNRTEPKPVGLNRFRFGFGFFLNKKIFDLVIFFIKTKPNRTVNTPTSKASIFSLKRNFIFTIYKKTKIPPLQAFKNEKIYFASP
jgi:hypothetical protein